MPRRFLYIILIAAYRFFTRRKRRGLKPRKKTPT